MQGYLLLHTMRHRKPLLPQMGLKPCVRIQLNIEVWYVGVVELKWLELCDTQGNIGSEDATGRYSEIL